MDLGLVKYYRKNNGFMYKYMAHCTCRAGNQYVYDGQECERESKSFMANIDMVFDQERKEELAKENFKIHMKEEDKQAL